MLPIFTQGVPDTLVSLNCKTELEEGGQGMTLCDTEGMSDNDHKIRRRSLVLPEAGGGQ